MQGIRARAARLLKPFKAGGGGEAWMAGTSPAKTRRGANDRDQTSIWAPRVAKNLEFSWPTYFLFFRSLKAFEIFLRHQGFSKFLFRGNGGFQWVIGLKFGN
jgi:hypothetical protein